MVESFLFFRISRRTWRIQISLSRSFKRFWEVSSFAWFYVSVGHPDGPDSQGSKTPCSSPRFAGGNCDVRYVRYPRRRTAIGSASSLDCSCQLCQGSGDYGWTNLLSTFSYVFLSVPFWKNGDFAVSRNCLIFPRWVFCHAQLACTVHWLLLRRELRSPGKP